MNGDFVVCIIAVLATIVTMLSFVPAFVEAMAKNYDCTGKSVIKLLVSCLAFAIIVAIAFAYPLINATDKTIQSPTKYVGAEIVARGTDGAYFTPTYPSGIILMLLIMIIRARRVHTTIRGIQRKRGILFFLTGFVLSFVS